MKKIFFLFLSLILVLAPACNEKKQTGSSITNHETSSADSSLTGDETHEDADHTIMTVVRQPFHNVIRTSGRIIADNRDIEIITAKSPGIVRFSSNSFFPGVKVTTGQQLFTISGGQLADDNIEVRFRQVAADLGKAEADFDRANKLITDRIITQEHYLTIKNEFEKISEEYNNLKQSLGKSGTVVSSPVNGYIREVFVSEGEKVSAGQALASVISGKRLVLQADLPPGSLSDLRFIEKARFTTGYSQKVFKTEEMNGRKISEGKSTGDNSFYIPVFFSIDNDPELIEGTFVDVYLIGQEIPDAIVIPVSSVMEEYGKLYVFVETGEGNFIKRYITTGGNDGTSIMVTEGLKEGEEVVATGAYNVKLSLYSNQIPAHSHNH